MQKRITSKSVIQRRILIPLIILFFVVLTFVIPRIASPQGKITAKHVAHITSLAELKKILENKVLVVQALTKKRYWVFEEISEEMDLVETVTDRIRYLISDQGKEVKPSARSLFEQVVIVFDMIHETAAHEMEGLQIKAMDSENVFTHYILN